MVAAGAIAVAAGVAEVDDDEAATEAGGDVGLCILGEARQSQIFPGRFWGQETGDAGADGPQVEHAGATRLHLEAPMQKFAVALVQIVFVVVAVSHAV